LPAPRSPIPDSQAPLPGPFLTILADDLTGACDTGASFARRGWPVRVAFSPRADFSGAAVRVLSTETRSLSTEQAARVVEESAHALGLGAGSLVYKKIDSTLRGHPWVELAAVMRMVSADRALVCPAFPSQGRVVRAGRVWVRGVPLEETEFAQDVSQPDMRALFAATGKPRAVETKEIRQGADHLVEIFKRPGVIIADAGDDADLSTLALAARRAGLHVLCGSAGLARAYAGALPDGGRSLARVSADLPVITVVGSRSLVALAQVESCRQHGIIVIPIDPGRFRIVGNSGSLVEAGFLVGSGILMEPVQAPPAAARSLAMGQSILICPDDAPLLTGMEKPIAAGLAGVAASLMASVPVGGLVVSGGDTAAALLHALHCSAFDLGGEVTPGIVWGRLADGPHAGLPVITKAGGFGDPSTLLQAVDFLRTL